MGLRNESPCKCTSFRHSRHQAERRGTHHDPTCPQFCERASDYFRHLAGERSLQENPAARAVYECLEAFEDHHYDKHRECEEEQAREAAQLIESMKNMGFINPQPPAIPEWTKR